MTKILIPTDFSDKSKVALRFAMMIGNHLDSELVVFHAIEPPNPMATLMRKIDDLIRKDTLEDLRDFCEEMKKETGYSRPMTFDCLEGVQAETTAVFAEKNKIDLVIVGSKGATGLKKAFLGSNAGAIITACSCPVISVPAQTEIHEIKDIVYATDMKDTVHELPELISFARLFDARIHAVHFYKETLFGSQMEDEKMAERMIKKYDYPHITFESILNEDVVSGIDQYLDEKGADMLALFQHGEHKGLMDNLFGTSVTREMAFHNKVPLFAFKN